VQSIALLVNTTQTMRPVNFVIHIIAVPAPVRYQLSVSHVCLRYSKSYGLVHQEKSVVLSVHSTNVKDVLPTMYALSVSPVGTSLQPTPAPSTVLLPTSTSMMRPVSPALSAAPTALAVSPRSAPPVSPPASTTGTPPPSPASSARTLASTSPLPLDSVYLATPTVQPAFPRPPTA